MKIHTNAENFVKVVQGIPPFGALTTRNWVKCQFGGPTTPTSAPTTVKFGTE